MPKPPVVTVDSLEQQQWLINSGRSLMFLPFRSYQHDLRHRGDGPAWLVITATGTIQRWINHGRKFAEVHPMSSNLKPQYWAKGANYYA